MGPTASGKSAVAIELAKRFPVEIVSVDSAQIYRRMDIGTAKPDAATRERYRHHLIDIADPTDSYSAGQFRDDALAAIDSITARGRVALLVGGTMLYFKALRDGLSNLPPANAATRARIDAIARESGWPSLHAELSRADPRTAARLDPKDAQRIQRALEVFYLTGSPLSELLAAGRTTGLSSRLIQIALLPSDRGALHNRIEARFRQMLERGFVAEVEALRREFTLRADLPSMRCVGYRQVWQYLEGNINLRSLHDKGVAATRQLAKRQLTWLRAMTQLHEFDCFAGDLPAQVTDCLAGELELTA